VNTNNAQSVLFKICALAGQIGLRAGQLDRGSKCVNVPQNAGRVAAMLIIPQKEKCSSWQRELQIIFLNYFNSI